MMTGRLQGRQHGEKQVEQDKRIRIPRGRTEPQVQCGVHRQHDAEGDDEAPRSAELRDGVGNPLAGRGLALYHYVGITHRPSANQLLRDMEVPSENGEHVEARERFLLQQVADIVKVDLQTRRLFDRDRPGLVLRLFEQRRKPKEVALAGLIEYDLLPVLVHGKYPDLAGDHDIGAGAEVADLVDALPRHEPRELDLAREHRELFVVEQGKQRNLSQNLGIAGHRKIIPYW